MMIGDRLEDYNPATSHLHICRKNESSDEPCNRHCIHMLYELTSRLSRLVHG